VTGVGSIWDKTAVEARVDPSQDQSKLGTSLSKSLPLNEQTSLTLQNGYNVIQQGAAPITGAPLRPLRNYQADQSAKLSLTDTGTSFTAGQSLSSTDDKWLRKIAPVLGTRPGHLLEIDPEDVSTDILEAGARAYVRALSNAVRRHGVLAEREAADQPAPEVVRAP